MPLTPDVSHELDPDPEIDPETPAYDLPPLRGQGTVDASTWIEDYKHDADFFLKLDTAIMKDTFSHDFAWKIMAASGTPID